ncbi:MAG: GNAT family N-acetyltransferase [Bacteroidales bacterium]|nr:GNAT family N-acetyltransferase [Bacteroidales bacterium]
MFFETKNLIIDKLTEADAVFLCRICNQPFVLQWMEDWKHSLEEIQELIAFFIQGYSLMCPAKHVLALAIRFKDTKELIGICGFGTKKELGGEVEICYFIDEAFSNKGYMGQVVEKAIKYYFDLTGQPYLCAMVDKNNIPSYRLLQKNGFVFYPMKKTGGVQSHYRVYANRHETN